MIKMNNHEVINRFKKATKREIEALEENYQNTEDITEKENLAKNIANCYAKLQQYNEVEEKIGNDYALIPEKPEEVIASMDRVQNMINYALAVCDKYKDSDCEFDTREFDKNLCEMYNNITLLYHFEYKALIHLLSKELGHPIFNRGHVELMHQPKYRLIYAYLISNELFDISYESIENELDKIMYVPNILCFITYASKYIDTKYENIFWSKKFDDLSDKEWINQLIKNGIVWTNDKNSGYIIKQDFLDLEDKDNV